MKTLATNRMRVTYARLRDTGAGLLLVIATVFSTCAHAGQGVWTSNGPAGGDVRALAIDPSNPATVYAGTYGGGVFKSTNSGGTWAATNTGLPNLYVSALAIDPANPATLYAGASGVFKSTDSGGTWTAVDAGLTDLHILALAIDPANPSTLYAGAFGGGVFKSTNSGGTWAAVNTGLASYYLYVEALAINPMAPTTLYVGAFGPQVFKSTDSGGTWSATGLNDPWGYTDVFALVVNPANPATLYASTDSGVFKSTDGGAGWSAINTGLTSTDGTGLTSTDVRVLAIDPRNAATLYAGASNGVFKSTDGGASWTAISTGLTNADVWALAIDSANPSTLYAGTRGAGVFKSTTGTTGETWLLPSSAHSTGANGAFYTTNVAVANVGAASASFTMKFLGHDQQGSGGPEQTFNLEAGRSVTYFDVLGSVFHETSAFGAIRISSDTPSLNIVSVTSTPGCGGTLSQTIPVISSSNLIPAGSSRSILYIREGDGFRSNLVLASNANVSTMVDAALLSSDGTTLATKSYSVPPNGMTQINRVVRDMGVSSSITGARLVLSSSTPSAAFTGFASVIDETTNDPTAVEAR